MEEYKAVEFTAYKDAKGFERSLTIRGDSGSEVISSMDKAIEAIMEKGGTPIAKSFSAVSNKMPQVPTSSVATKLCEIHQAQMKEKVSKKDGRTFYSHSKGVYPNLEWCSGKGYPDEFTKAVDDVNF